MCLVRCPKLPSRPPDAWGRPALHRWCRVLGRLEGLGALWGFGFRVQGSGFRVQGSGFRVQGSGFRVFEPGGLDVFQVLEALNLGFLRV